jgi:hypothetical protein
MSLDRYSDNERLGFAAYWAEDTALKLAAGLNAGLFGAISTEEKDLLGLVHNGLMTLAENLGALNLPFPPPMVPAPNGRNLRVVK